MTEEEKKEIVDAVIARINANTQAVEDLPTSDNLSDFTTLPVLGSDGSMKKLRADRLKGERGAAMTFAQLTESEKAQLKGEKGDKMTFADLTSEEKAQLKGDKGDALTFSMLTDDQKAQLKGQKGEKGATGPQGPQGVKGDTGAQGSKGDKGEKGDTGASVDTVNVSTLPSGSPATASISADHKTLTLGIPKGDKMTYADLTDVDKTDLATYNGMPILSIDTSDHLITLQPNHFHKITFAKGEFNIYLQAPQSNNKAVDYDGEITIGTVVPTLNWDSNIVWVSDIPVLTASTRYEFSIRYDGDKYYMVMV